MKKINILIPIYNEEESISELVHLILDVVSNLHYKFSFTLIEDADSQDSSWEIIKKLKINNVDIKKIKLSRNFGHQGAIFCGLDEFNEDAVLIIDSDFQDNPKYLPELIKEWESGNGYCFSKTNW